jgi:hypothetical protein
MLNKIKTHIVQVIDISLNESGDYVDHPPENYITNIAVNEISRQLGIKYDRS